MQETKILANEVNQYKDQLQNCNIELDKLNYRANYGTITTSTSCDNTKSEELVRQLQECEEKNKENEYLIYS
ncbi:MAG: hypothetical protein LBU14_05700 [Candidatus Peribacteria bacterium]|jgi:hypothetical protein|nr:hypothetical protein [Candidatus Peribacteria bacterium]